MELRCVISAVGIWFYSVRTDRYLYLLRNDRKKQDTWGLPGGKIESNETLHEAMQRECEEELGYMPECIKIMPIEKFTSPDDKFTYHTFFAVVEDEFTPTLNDEHHGYSWISSGTWPKPMHPGLWNTVNFEEVLDKVQVIRTQQL